MGLYLEKSLNKHRLHDTINFIKPLYIYSFYKNLIMFYLVFAKV